MAATAEVIITVDPDQVLREAVRRETEITVSLKGARDRLAFLASEQNRLSTDGVQGTTVAEWSASLGQVNSDIRATSELIDSLVLAQQPASEQVKSARAACVSMARSRARARAAEIVAEQAPLIDKLTALQTELEGLAGAGHVTLPQVFFAVFLGFKGPLLTSWRKEASEMQRGTPPTKAAS